MALPDVVNADGDARAGLPAACDCAHHAGQGTQLVLDLALPASSSRADLVVGACNADAWQRISAWPKWPVPGMVLIGPAGSGKSHMAAIWAAQADAIAYDAGTLTIPALGDHPEARPVLIEDACRAGYDERALFHLLNLAKEHGFSVLMTARTPPKAWGIGFADLASRLALMPVAAITEPDLDHLKVVLFKHFIDRQLEVEPGLIDYLALRMMRSTAAAARLVADLDHEALSRGRRITRPLARAVLARYDLADANDWTNPAEF